MMADKMYVQIDDEIREMTFAEVSELKATQAQAEAMQAETDARVASRESALAKLAKLGLTPEEVAAL